MEKVDDSIENLGLFTAFTTLYMITTAIKTDMCSALSKTVFSDVKCDEMTGKKYPKASRVFLTKSIISMVNAVEGCLDPIVDNTKLIKHFNDHDSVKSEIASSSALAESVDNAIRQHSADIEQQGQQLREIQDMISKLTISTTNLCNPVPAATQFTSGMAQQSMPDITSPEAEYSSYQDDFLTPEEEEGLMKFLSGIDYAGENGHGVKNFGAEYQYTRAADSAEDSIPPELNTVIEKVKLAYPGVEINQCLVNCYSGPDSKLSEHSDNELCIDPESSIFSISLGQERTIQFRDMFSDATSQLTVKPRSLYSMTRSSQAYYTHKIDKAPGSTLRYSITLRTIGQQFRKSTLIIGDSNSKYLEFGEGKGTFGRGQPGKRVKAAYVEDINPHDCAAYANVVLMVGTNDLREKFISSREDIKNVFATLDAKVHAIRCIRKDIRIVLLPVLPTRLPGMNRSIQMYNGDLYNHFVCSGLYFNINMPSMDEVCVFYDNGMLLNRVFTRSGEDSTHLNGRGLANIARVIKLQIYKSSSKVVAGKTYNTAAGGGRRGGGPT